jgi:type II secretory pathway predicted ATPase ExeA
MRAKAEGRAGARRAGRPSRTLRGVKEKWFNIAGPCIAAEHYMIPAARRSREAATLIAQGRWFSLVSGRQTGKTTIVQYLAQALDAGGAHRALWIDLQTARGIADPARAFTVVLDAMDRTLARDQPTLARPSREAIARWLATPEESLLNYLSALCGASDRPMVLLFDEADVLVGAAMVSFLTQLRALYLARRQQPSPFSVVLIGVRSIRDYVVPDERMGMSWLGSASPFNVTVENVTLAAFTEGEVAELCGQHTEATGQRFEPDAIARIHGLSAGHPWLVNALADQATRRDVQDRTVTITAGHIDSAKDTIIQERRTHIDSLLARLREDRVRRVLDPMLSGGHFPAEGLDDDVAYVAGLGLLRKESGRWAVANEIYREVIPRVLNETLQSSLDQRTAWYLRADGLIDVGKLMGAWQTFWREDGHVAAQGFSYRESGPHLMLMAFLQRIVNGGGRIDREYALGKGALDLLVTWRTQRVAIELKVRHRPTAEARGVEQLGRYLASLGLDEGWLVLFDLRGEVSWDERIFTRIERVEGRTIHVIGC